MKVKLVRHTFPDRPDWVLIEESVPLGTIYEVIGYDAEVSIYNQELKETRKQDHYIVIGNGDKGYLPTCVFEVVK